MWVGLQHRALGFDADLISAELAPGDIELLLRSEAIDIRGTRLALARLLICQECNLRAAQVADALAQYEVAVVMHAGFDEVAIELIGHARGAGLELLQIGFRPPVPQAAQVVELGALIVEAVRNFVADHYSDR